MPHKFVIIVDGIEHTYRAFEDIPDQIDLVVEFAPEYPPEPHTDQQHDEIAQWPDQLDELLRREKCRQ